MQVSPGAARGVPADDPGPAALAGRRPEDRRPPVPPARRPHAGRPEAGRRRGAHPGAERHGPEEGSAHPAGARGATAIRRTPSAAEAHDTASALVADLRAHAPNATITIVGSLRRGCDTCGDIDILAAGAPSSLMDRFIEYRLVERVLGRGDTKSSVLLWGGFQADLRLVPRESLGAALQYFTGSKAHNIAVRDRAIAARLQAERVRPLHHRRGRSRRRRGRGRDLRATRPGLRPARTAGEPRRDRRRRAARAALRSSSSPTCAATCHMHTTASDGRATAEEMARAARDAGLRYIAITEHSQSLAMANGLDEHRALEHARQIRALNDRGSTASPSSRGSSATSGPMAPWTSPTTASPASISSSPRSTRPSPWTRPR
jgi:hypothetical protein